MKRRVQRRGAVFGAPVLIALVSGAALIVGLLGSGGYDLLSWIGVGLPLAVILWASLTRRS